MFVITLEEYVRLIILAICIIALIVIGVIEFILNKKDEINEKKAMKKKAMKKGKS